MGIHKMPERNFKDSTAPFDAGAAKFAPIGRRIVKDFAPMEGLNVQKKDVWRATIQLNPVQDMATRHAARERFVEELSQTFFSCHMATGKTSAPCDTWQEAEEAMPKGRVFSLNEFGRGVDSHHYPVLRVVLIRIGTCRQWHAWFNELCERHEIAWCFHYDGKTPPQIVGLHPTGYTFLATCD